MSAPGGHPAVPSVIFRPNRNRCYCQAPRDCLQESFKERVRSEHGFRVCWFQRLFIQRANTGAGAEMVQGLLYRQMRTVYPELPAGDSTEEVAGSFTSCRKPTQPGPSGCTWHSCLPWAGERQLTTATTAGPTPGTGTSPAQSRLAQPAAPAERAPGNPDNQPQSLGPPLQQAGVPATASLSESTRYIQGPELSGCPINTGLSKTSTFLPGPFKSKHPLL